MFELKTMSNTAGRRKTNLTQAIIVTREGFPVVAGKLKQMNFILGALSLDVQEKISTSVDDAIRVSDPIDWHKRPKKRKRQRPTEKRQRPTETGRKRQRRQDLDEVVQRLDAMTQQLQLFQRMQNDILFRMDKVCTSDACPAAAVYLKMQKKMQSKEWKNKFSRAHVRLADAATQTPRATIEEEN